MQIFTNITNDEWENGYEYIRDAMISQNNNVRILAETKEGNVYFYENLGVVIKERKYDYQGSFPPCNICIKREFAVGRLANKYNSPFLVKTIGYFENNGASYIITEYVQGVALSKVKSRSFYISLFNIIKELQGIMEFTHYDLHSDNVMIQPDGSIKIIDLARSHIKGIGSMFAESGIIDSATTPGIFDPIFDYAFILGYLFIEYGDRSFGEELFERNNIGYNDIVGYPKQDDIFILIDLFTNGKIWASTVPGPYSMEEVYKKFSFHKLIHILMKNGDKILTDAEKDYELDYDPEYSNPKFKGEEIANNIFWDNDPEFQMIVDEYVIMLGQAAAHDKLLAMSLRKDTPETFYNAAITFINNNVPDHH